MQKIDHITPARQDLLLKVYAGEDRVLTLLHYIDSMSARMEIYHFLIRTGLKGRNLFQHWEAKGFSMIAVIAPILQRLRNDNDRKLYAKDFIK